MKWLTMHSLCTPVPAGENRTIALIAFRPTWDCQPLCDLALYSSPFTHFQQVTLMNDQSPGPGSFWEDELILSLHFGVHMHRWGVGEDPPRISRFPVAFEIKSCFTGLSSKGLLHLMPVYASKLMFSCFLSEVLYVSQMISFCTCGHAPLSFLSIVVKYNLSFTIFQWHWVC